MRALLLLITLACAAKPPKQIVTPEKLYNFYNKVKTVESWLPYCKYPDNFVGPSKETCVSEGTGTGDGDMMKFGGLLCLANVTSGCELVARSCEPNGRCWRSPARVNNDTPPTFSRDQFLGLMAYLIKTHDVTTASRVRNYHESIGGRVCDQNHMTCEYRITTTSLFVRVIDFLLKAQTHDNLLDDLSLLASARFSPAGYELELVASTILLRQRMGQHTVTLQEAARILTEREPMNPFFWFVYHGISDKVLDIALAQIPDTSPERRYKWSFEVKNEEEPWRHSMGWEWVFLRGLLKQ